MPLLELGEGVFKTNQEPLVSFLAAYQNSHNVTILGKGPGVTEIQGSLTLKGWFPEIRNIAFYDDPANPTGWTLLRLENPGIFRLENIWCHPPLDRVGLAIRTTDGVIIPQMVHWPPRNAPIGGARISVSSIRDLYIYGDGHGMSIHNNTTAAQTNGQFANHVRIDGGHIRVGQRACIVSPTNEDNIMEGVVFSNFHIDVGGGDGDGLKWNKGSRITWYAPGFVEPGSNIKANGGTWLSGPAENFRVYGHWPRIGHYP